MGKILVVDDDRILGEMLQYMLKNEGYEVAFIKNPQLALGHIVDDGTQVVLLDKLMQQVDGSDVCREIKADARTSNIPVLMMSGLVEARETCLEAGADDFLEKPFEREELLSKVENMFNRV